MRGASIPTLHPLTYVDHLPTMFSIRNQHRYLSRKAHLNTKELNIALELSIVYTASGFDKVMLFKKQSRFIPSYS